MLQRGKLYGRVPYGALVMPERSAGKLARSVLRGEAYREVRFLPGGYNSNDYIQRRWLGSYLALR